MKLWDDVTEQQNEEKENEKKVGIIKTIPTEQEEELSVGSREMEIAGSHSSSMAILTHRWSIHISATTRRGFGQTPTIPQPLSCLPGISTARNACQQYLALLMRGGLLGGRR